MAENSLAACILIPRRCVFAVLDPLRKEVVVVFAVEAAFRLRCQFVFQPAALHSEQLRVVINSAYVLEEICLLSSYNEAVGTFALTAYCDALGMGAATGSHPWSAEDVKRYMRPQDVKLCLIGAATGSHRLLSQASPVITCYRCTEAG